VPVNPRNYAILVAILLAFRVWRYFAKRAASSAAVWRGSCWRVRDKTLTPSWPPDS